MNTGNRLGIALAMLVILLAVAGPLLGGDPTAPVEDGIALAPPSGAHWLGTDSFGRDEFARLAHGARLSLTVAAVAVVMAAIIGVVLGLLAGGLGGRSGRLFSWLIDLALALPRVVVLLVLVATTGRLGPAALGIVLGLTGWPAIARLVRGEARRLKEAEFVAAARALGATTMRRLFREILPGTLPPALVAATLGVADVLLLEAGLAYLGIGIRPPTPTWGGMILDAQSQLHNAPWLLLAPGLALVAATAAATLLGDTIRQRLQSGDR